MPAVASASSVHAAKLHEILVQELYRRALFPLVFFIPILYLLYRILESAIAVRPAIAWVFVGMIGVLVPRIATIIFVPHIQRRYPDPRVRAVLFAVFVALLGTGMAAINILAAPVVTPEQLALMAIVAAGINSIAIISMSSSLWSYFLYMIPNIASMAIAVMIGPQLQFGGALLFVICLNLVSLIVVATYVHVESRKSILLRLQVDDVNGALRDSNSRLQSQIAERLVVEEALRQRNADLELAHRRLADAQSQLVQAEKLASVGQLAAGVAHEINNPLAFIRSNFNHLAKCTQDMLGLLDAYAAQEEGRGEPGNSRRLQSLKRDANLDFVREDLPDLVRESTNGIDRVARIVSDLKAFTHIDRSPWQVLDLHESIDQTLSVVAHQIRHKADLVREYGDLPAVECMPAQINQALLNILLNAIQSIQSHGTVTVRTSRQAALVCVQVTDTGCGIDPSDLPKIFDPFFTTREVGAGVGLGLTSVHRIAEQHNGRVEVQSTLGEGSTFALWLPITQSSPRNES
jgi:two-component system NtrC family sensor kinase